MSGKTRNVQTVMHASVKADSKGRCISRHESDFGRFRATCSQRRCSVTRTTSVPSLLRLRPGQRWTTSLFPLGSTRGCLPRPLPRRSLPQAGECCYRRLRENGLATDSYGRATRTGKAYFEANSVVVVARQNKGEGSTPHSMDQVLSVMRDVRASSGSEKWCE